MQTYSIKIMCFLFIYLQSIIINILCFRTNNKNQYNKLILLLLAKKYYKQYSFYSL